MITVPGGGSSSVFRNACGDSPVMRSASSTMNTFDGPRTGLSAAARSRARMSSMRIARGPLGRSAGGLGASTCRSGCAELAAPRSTRANSTAAALRPDPGGPTNA